MRAAALGLILIGGPCIAAEPIDADQFTKLHTLIKPSAAEDKWNEIPWLSNLWQARKQAAAEGKPILLWEMDGNPLGCV